MLVAGFATYLCRVSFIVLGDRVTLPPIIESGLRYVAPATFAAISLPIVLGGNGITEFADDVPRIVAAGLACAVVWKIQNLALSLLTGMATLWLLLWLF